MNESIVIVLSLIHDEFIRSSSLLVYLVYFDPWNHG